MSSNSINLRGIRTGTPVPSIERENAAKPGNALVTYTMPLEEMAAYLQKYEKRKGRLEVDMSITVERTEVSMDDYLKLRVKGINRLDAGKQLGLGPVNLSACLKEWAIDDKKAEQAAIQKMAEEVVQSRRTPDPVPEEQATADKPQPTKEEYMELRLKGTGRTAACRQLGIAKGSIAYTLQKWGLEDAEEEERLLAEMRAAQNQTSPTVPTATERTMVKSQTLDHIITVAIPSTPAKWPESMPVPKVDRDALIVLGVACLRNAAAWARQELNDLLGSEEIEDHVQAFMARKCAEILSEVNERESIEARSKAM